MNLVRGVMTLLIRWICSLALLVAAMPLKAGVESCVAPVKTPVKQCGMACCEKKPMAKMACMEQVDHSRWAKSADPCGCEIKSAPATPPAVVKAVPVMDPIHLFAILPETVPAIPVPVSFAEPGIFGVDSGPPPQCDTQPGLGRAPPVAVA